MGPSTERRVRGTGPGGESSGGPFLTKQSANFAPRAKNLADTHEVVQTGPDSFVLRPVLSSAEKAEKTSASPPETTQAAPAEGQAIRNARIHCPGPDARFGQGACANLLAREAARGHLDR